jgi:hypothetical protein
VLSLMCGEGNPVSERALRHIQPWNKPSSWSGRRR